MSELAHYGVKGMKWGVRRAELNAPNQQYTAGSRAYDKTQHGKRGVKRINRRLNQGKTLDQARTAERRRNARQRVAVGVGILFGPEIAYGARVMGNVIKLSAGVAAQSVAKRAETNRGRAAVSDAMGLPRKASTGPDYAKNRKGVYNISSL
jgi:hypothetical protein